MANSAFQIYWAALDGIIMLDKIGCLESIAIVK